MNKLVGFILSGAIGGLIVLGGLQITDSQDNAATLEQQNTLGQLTAQNDVIQNAPFDFRKASSMTMPTVVHIKSTISSTASNDSDRVPQGFKDLFGEDFGSLFGNPFGDRGPREGSGSGVIIQNNGYIVTNNHVIDGADQIEVTLYDKRKYEAEVVGTDPSTDLAVLKIENTNLPTIDFANSDQVEVGEWVLAVGNPFNLTSTATAGIVSAKGRDINIMEGAGAIESFIQTDAAVNPGNSGGALVDIEGNLIGINTAIASRTGYFSGYSFAIPANIVQKIVNDIIEFGSPQRGFLGISIENMDGDLADDLGVYLNEGVHVVRVGEGTPAEEGGLQEDDIIIAVNDIEVKSAPELQELVGRQRPGDTVNLKVHRKGRNTDIPVKLRKLD